MPIAGCHPCEALSSFAAFDLGPGGKLETGLLSSVKRRLSWSLLAIRLCRVKVYCTRGAPWSTVMAWLLCLAERRGPGYITCSNRFQRDRCSNERFERGSASAIIFIFRLEF
jgi:hypothetical protein